MRLPPSTELLYTHQPYVYNHEYPIVYLQIINTENKEMSMIPEEEKEEEKIEDVDESEEILAYRYTITSYGADYPVDGLVKRLNAGDIIVPTFDPTFKLEDEIEAYQRQFIWTKRQCDRFIESLLLGLPVPGIFLVKLDDGRFLVLDGQQRLRTLQCFYKGILRDKEFVLENVQKHLIGLKYETLDADRRILDNSIIHATIVKQDEPSEDLSSIYLVFERLNTGGTTLHPQEIRVALYRGGLINFLRDINNFKPWREIYGKKSNRFKDQELILRFFALLYWSDKYERPMKDFLNKYTAANRNFQIQNKDELTKIFQQTIETIHKAFGNKAFRLTQTAALNAAVMDSIMVAIGERIRTDKPIKDIPKLKILYEELLKNKDFLFTVQKATTNEENVKKRMKLAREIILKA